MRKLEYIASGTSYLRLNAPRNGEGPSHEKLRMFIKKVEENTDHKFGLLYNAFVEKNFGPCIAKYKDIVSSIHSDSGGLQMITRNLAMTEDIKAKIYKNQGTYSGYAMSFDEAPVLMTSSTSARTDVSARRFDLDHFKEAAKITGNNIRGQIESFLDMGTTTKPIFIAHGNCYDTYMMWADIAMKQIPDNIRKHVGGVAMGGTAIGYGMLEDIEKASYFRDLPIDTKHLHILGVGSSSRLLPYLTFAQNGFYPDDLHISYDSTTHTSGVEFGHYNMKDHKSLVFNRDMSESYHMIFNDMSKLVDLSQYDVNFFHDIMNTGYTKYIEKGGREEDFLTIRTAFIIKSIINFCNFVDSIRNDKDKMLDVASRRGIRGPISSLFEVRSKDDFDHWLYHANHNTPSRRISSRVDVNFDEAFDSEYLDEAERIMMNIEEEKARIKAKSKAKNAAGTSASIDCFF